MKLSVPVPPTSASIAVAFMPDTLTAFAPVMLQLLPPATPVKVSLPVPPVRLVMPLNVVVVFSVPAFAPVTCHAFVPSVAATVSVPAPPPPPIEPLNVATPLPKVKLSVPVPPTSASIPVKLVTRPVTLPAFAPLTTNASPPLFPVRLSLPVPPLIVPIVPSAPRLKLSPLLSAFSVPKPVNARLLPPFVTVPLSAPLTTHDVAPEPRPLVKVLGSAAVMLSMLLKLPLTPTVEVPP